LEELIIQEKKLQYFYPHFVFHFQTAPCFLLLKVSHPDLSSNVLKNEIFISSDVWWMVKMMKKRWLRKKVMKKSMIFKWFFTRGLSLEKFCQP